MPECMALECAGRVAGHALTVQHPDTACCEEDKESCIHIVYEIVGFAHLPDIVYRGDKSEDQHDRHEDIDIKFPEPFEESNVKDDDQQFSKYMGVFPFAFAVV